MRLINADKAIELINNTIDSFRADQYETGTEYGVCRQTWKIDWQIDGLEYARDIIEEMADEVGQ